MRRIAGILFLCFLLSACVPGQDLTDQEKAQAALTQFLEGLSEGMYAEAVKFYGGSYDHLRSMNPLVPADDFQALWQNGCQLNGLQCLPLLRVANVEESVLGEFLFTVELNDGSGQPFEQESCCGDSEGQPVSRFEFRVKRSNGDYLVVDMPPYLP